MSARCKPLLKSLLLGALLCGQAVLAQTAPPASMEELLNQVEQGRASEARENAEREARFAQDQAHQAELLKALQAERQAEEARAAELEATFDANEKQLAMAEQTLRERMGSLSDLFNDIHATASDLHQQFSTSLVSTQYHGRNAFLEDLVKKSSDASRLPSIEEIERLWFEIQREMTESGKVVAYNQTVVRPDGEHLDETVFRVGSFNLVSQDGRYLAYDNTRDVVFELPRQPAAPYRKQSAGLAAAGGAMVPFALDPTGPSGGGFLRVLVEQLSPLERIQQGGRLGYAIMALGLVSVLVGVWRLVLLEIMNRRVQAQRLDKTARLDNPLGRLMAVYGKDPLLDPEALELRLDEALIKEKPALVRGQIWLRMASAFAPLLGLLGTVLGLIATFQGFTLASTVDAGAMANGIAAAMVTTVQGLCAAIPVMLLSAAMLHRSQRITALLEEQVAHLLSGQALPGPAATAAGSAG